MPLTLDSPTQTHFRLPKTRSGGPSSRSPSELSSGSDDGSSAYPDSPIGASAVYSPISPQDPSFAFGDFKRFKSPHPSQAAVQGSSQDSRHKGIKAVYLERAYPTSSLAKEALHEEPAELGTQYEVDEKHDLVAEEDVKVGRKDSGEKIAPNARVVALDFDDVCCQYIPTLLAEHNAKYGTDLTPADMQTYVFWQNRGFGTPAETQRKLAQLDTALPDTAPVPGFAAALKAIKALGHPLHIVTARAEHFKPDIEAWLNMHGISVGSGPDDVVAAIWCCSSYSKEPIPELRETASAMEEEAALNERLVALFGKGKSGNTKLKVIQSINAALFIDDHHGNLEPIVHSDPPLHCLLFGDYPWNRSRSGVATPGELLPYDERIKAGLEITVDDIELGLYLQRVKGWEDVVQWVEKWDQDAMEE